jgi:hypothetical protein
MEARKLLPLLTAVAVVALLALIWFFPPTGDFRVGNPFWNGYSGFSGSFNATAISSINGLPANSSGTVLVEVPYAPFTSQDLSRLQQFVAGGGTLVLMDDYGYGNQVLEYLGLNASFSGVPLLDPLFHYKNDFFPRISNFAPLLNLTSTAYFAMDRGTVLLTNYSSGVLAWSSSFSFLSPNSGSANSVGATLGPLPVAYYQRIDKGMVIAVADPSIIINSMIGVDSNYAFINNIINLNGNHGAVYIDQSHLPVTTLDEAKLALDLAYSAASSPFGAAAIIIAILALGTLPLWRKNDSVTAGASNKKPRKSEDEDHDKSKGEIDANIP